jgi:Arc/MetJ-type ribon-helix-helix transcriptional regulator
MELQLTPDQEALIDQAVSSGRYPTPADAVREAVARWEDAERARYELIASLELAEADLAAGRYTDYSGDELPALADDLKREGRKLTKSRQP